MNGDQIGGLIRTLMAIIGGYVLAKGWVSEGTWTWIVGGVVSIVPAIWSWASNRPASIAASAQALPGVNVVTTSGASPSVIAAVNGAK